MEQEACVDPQLSAGALVEVVGLDELDGLRGEVSSVAADGSVYVELKLPYGEMLLEAANVRVVGERFGDWEKVMSSSTSPGDFYWFNWETGESSWEEPEEVTRSLGASVIPPVHHPAGPSPTSFGGASSTASRKRAFPCDTSAHSHYQTQHDDSDANSGSDGSSAAAPSSSSDAAAAAAAAAAAKEAKARELEQLRVRLGSLEQKKRKLEDSRSQQQVAEFAAQSMDSMRDVRDAINQRLQETLVKESGDSKSTLVVLSECIAPEAD